MTFIPIKKEITVGQILFAVVFLLGIAVTWGSTIKDLEKLNTAINSAQTHFVRKDELAAELRGLHQELSDLKLIAYTSILKRQLTQEETDRIGKSINGR